MRILAFDAWIGLTWTSGLAVAQNLLDLCPCERLPSSTYLGGVSDNYAQPVDPASRGPELNTAFPNNIWKNFDDATVNAHVGFTFANLPSDIVCAQLEIHLRPSGDLSDNDTLYLGLLPSLTGTFAWAIRLHDLPGTGGVWDPPLDPPPFTLDLGNLAGGNAPGTSLLAQMNAEHRLDLLVQDDTQVDYVKLTLHTFPEQTVTVGLADNFVAPTEATSRGTQLNAAFPGALWKDLDDSTPDRSIGHTFNLTGNVVQASLEARLLPHANVPTNDSLSLGLNSGAAFAFSSPIRNLPGAGGTWATNPPTTFLLDLGALPGGGSLLPKMSTDQRLDLLIQDDSAADYLRLRYRTCPSPKRLAGLPQRAIGRAILEQDATGAVVLSGLGSGATPTDGVHVDLGDAGGFATTQILDPATTLEGAVMQSTTFGELGGVRDHSLGTLGMMFQGGLYHALVDYSPLGADQYRASFYDGSGHLVQQAMLSKPDSVSFSLASSSFIHCGCDRHNWTWQVKKPGKWQIDGDVFNSFEATTVVFEPVTTLPLSGTLSAVEIKAANMPKAVFHEEIEPVPGIGLEGLGASQLATASGAATITGIGSTGLDGVSVDLGRAASTEIAFAPIDPAGSAPAGAHLDAQAFGEIGNLSGQSLGTLRVTRLADNAGFEAKADFSNIGSPTQKIQLFRANRLVKEIPGHVGLAGRFSRWFKSLGKLGGATECYVMRFPPDTAFRIDGVDLAGDELRVLAETNVALGAKSAFQIRAAGLPDLTLTDVGIGGAGSCTPGPTTLCLNGGRFAVDAEFAAPTGERGQAQAVPLTLDTGYFYFFSPQNVELVVKALTGCPLNGRFWIFSGGLTNVEVDLRVTDTLTGQVKHYVNPLNTPYPPKLDTDAFATCDAGKLSVGTTGLAETAEATAAELQNLLASLNAGATRQAASSAKDASELLLNGGRFRVTATYRTPQGQTGTGQAVRITEDAGYFWFFNPDNVEVTVKALNACALNSRFWVFASGLTNVEVVITVTDTRNGTSRSYTNPLNTSFMPIQDTNAFATCP